MVVLIINVTDAPGSARAPTELDIYNKTLSPGAQLKIPADLVNAKIRALEKGGFIAIGSLPAWYLAAKSRKGKPLSEEEKRKRQSVPPPVLQMKPKEKEESKRVLETIEEPASRRKG